MKQDFVNITVYNCSMHKMATLVGANLLLSVDILQYNITVQKEHQQRWRVKFMPQIDNDASYYAGSLLSKLRAL